jgi:hypothetical protein
MRGATFAGVWALLVAASLPAACAGEPASCFEEEVLRHVREQFALYGPRSNRHGNEYFGFIYRMDGRIDSAVTVGDDCSGETDCAINPVFALRRVPRGAKILGEWHSHPRGGSSQLSPEDVRGANANRHVQCYAAFYSAPDGSIWRWSVGEAQVDKAMASRILVGNFRASLP